MTPEQEHERMLLNMMTPDTHKFAIAVNYPLGATRQLALERLLERDWIRLLDVSMVANSRGQLVRIFKVMPEAVLWMKFNPLKEARHP